jgi:hypothetical protein
MPSLVLLKFKFKFRVWLLKRAPPTRPDVAEVIRSVSGLGFRIGSLLLFDIRLRAVGE